MSRAGCISGGAITFSVESMNEMHEVKSQETKIRRLDSCFLIHSDHYNVRYSRNLRPLITKIILWIRKNSKTDNDEVTCKLCNDICQCLEMDTDLCKFPSLCLTVCPRNTTHRFSLDGAEQVIWRKIKIGCSRALLFVFALVCISFKINECKFLSYDFKWISLIIQRNPNLTQLKNIKRLLYSYVWILIPEMASYS